ncbi:MAG: fibronectin type III domain-containing protein, partial [Bacteroidales bacterium]|nr:fibronectin type III domain-containing protein [Bacteroidales bacterium]
MAAQTGLPDPPNFLSASVVPESSPTRVLLRWEPSTDNNVAGYIIYKVVDNITTTLDTVSDRSVGTYEYLTSSANGGSEKFRMAAFDYAGYKSSITQPHSTIYLTSAYDKCAQTTTLSWSPYVGWDNGIVNYRVYRRFSGSDFQLIKTLP